MATAITVAGTAAVLLAGCTTSQQTAGPHSGSTPASAASHSSAPPGMTGAVVAVTVPTDQAPANLQPGSTVRIVGVHQGPEDLPLTGTVVAVRPHGELLTVDVFPQNFGAGDTAILTALLTPPSPLSLVQINGPITMKKVSAQ
ncbi:hypothetical protein [Gordonia sp. N1V]|uniref:hypothetical protein n=1 Tax=Gordonia sp. N1V TaxID=3034163 RepID=UPI0023E169C2|nr:hypothetical protein [Gordonia sp. N1V]MDF3285028.1 hypothetical protein [Gordonia sp. N1V]